MFAAAYSWYGMDADTMLRLLQNLGLRAEGWAYVWLRASRLGAAAACHLHGGYARVGAVAPPRAPTASFHVQWQWQSVTDRAAVL